MGRGQSVVAYHHADRTVHVPEQAQRRMAELAAEYGAPPLAAVRASAGTVRLFLIVAAPRHQQRLSDRLHALERSPLAGELQVYWFGEEPPPMMPRI